MSERRYKDIAASERQWALERARALREGGRSDLEFSMALDESAKMFEKDLDALSCEMSDEPVEATSPVKKSGGRKDAPAAGARSMKAKADGANDV